VMVAFETSPAAPLWITWKYTGTDALKFAGTFGASPGIVLSTGAFRNTGSRVRTRPAGPRNGTEPSSESPQIADVAAPPGVFPLFADGVVAAANARTAVSRTRNRFTCASLSLPSDPPIRLLPDGVASLSQLQGSHTVAFVRGAVKVAGLSGVGCLVAPAKPASAAL